MAETANIADIAAKISKEIFKHFGWFAHPLQNSNFACANENHLGAGKKPKATHPADVVLSYDDPYLGKRIYLHTDLKSYAKNSISVRELRKAFKSLASTIECARESGEWRTKYSVSDSEPHEVRGLLFVHNHDNEYEKVFGDIVKNMDLQSVPIAPGSVMHFLGPVDIQRLYSTANDIIRLKQEGELPKEFTFYYPDLVLTRRQGDVWDQAATIESLCGPFMVIKHASAESCGSGYLIYYNRPGSTPTEFEYLIDYLSRFQLLESGQAIRIRVVDPSAHADMKSIFETATKRYARACGFDAAREAVLSAIRIDRITAVVNNYNPGEIGWRP